jgi:hypothetical protein
MADWAKMLKKETGRIYNKAQGITELILQAGLDFDIAAWLKDEWAAVDKDWALRRCVAKFLRANQAQNFSALKIRCRARLLRR